MTEAPASFAQEQLWFIDEFHHGLAAHNVAHQVRLRGPLDVAALGRALDGLVARHEALRTRLVAGDDGRPVQLIDPPAPVPLELTDHAGLGREAASARLRELAEAEALHPFQLARDHLLRARLVRLAAAEHVLVIVAHRAVLDDWSAGLLLRDLAALYRAAAAGGAAGLAEPPQFAGYVAWQRQHLQGPVRTALDDYWRGAMAGFETSQFPADRPRPLLADHDGAVETAMIDPGLLDGLKELSRQADTTLDVTLLAALQALLHRYTGQVDVTIGAVSANRDRPQFASLVGSLANTLPVRADLSGDPAFTDLLGRVRQAAQAARDHQDLPFAQVVEALNVEALNVERDTSRFPVFQIGFGCREPAGDIESAGVLFGRENVEVRASMYDISFLAEPRPGGLWLEVTYTPALFDAATVRRLLGHLGVLLAGVAADPSARLSQLPVLTADELRRELTEWNDTAVQFPPVCIHQGFEAQVASCPDAVAAQFEGQRVSYAELNSHANRIARRLRALGAGPEALVGVCMRTGLGRLAALLGVWKAGAGYVPLDPEVPAERLAFMMADTQMTVVVTDEASAGCLPAVDDVTVLSLDAGQEQIRALDGSDLADIGVTPANVAYVIYTSGSTGRPKGVVVEHRQAINFLQGMAGPWRIGPSTVLLSFAAFTFDVSVMDMFMPLLAGGRVVLAPAGTLHSPPRLAALIRDARVTFACLPPAVLTLLRGEDFPDLRILLSAGEELSSELLRAWMRDGLEIYNGYGPTEASIGSTFMKLEPQTPLPPPIGRPKPNYQAYVLDTHLNPVPVGVTGELHIGGAGVARGYLGRPELTNERFIPDPFRPAPGARLYKTGDLVRRRADGTIVFAGRIDNQVKIRGLRVELGEIEAALAAHPAIAQAVVIVAADQAGSQQLVGYLRAAGGAAPEIADVRRHLARSLPGYMIPTYLIVLDELPLTAHGKIDKAALPAPQGSGAGAERVPPRTLIETILVDLYATVLGHEQLGTADSFFDVGGNSLQAMQLITKLRSTLAVDLDISDVFLTPTPQQLAGLLRGKHGFEDSDLGPDGIAELTVPAAPAAAGPAGAT
ncbi:MAG TPA: amino acid adenylation domain-containing protein [Streptosporangiaceae bacterium]